MGRSVTTGGLPKDSLTELARNSSSGPQLNKEAYKEEKMKKNTQSCKERRCLSLLVEATAVWGTVLLLMVLLVA